MKKLTIAILAYVLIFILALEILLRVIQWGQAPLHRIDPILGHSPIPNAQGWHTVEGHEYIRMNSIGHRDVEHSIKKPANTIRIAVLGDSYTEALHVDLPEAYWKVAESELNEHCSNIGESTVEMVNFGVRGYGTAQQYILMQNRVWQYNPDLLLLGFLGVNDVAENSKELDNNGISRNPFYVFEGDELVLDNSFHEHPIFIQETSTTAKIKLGLLRYFRSAQLYRYARGYFRQMSAKKEEIESSPVKNTLLPDGLNREVFAPPETEDWHTAWKITETLLEWISNEAAKHGIPFLVAVIGSGIEVHPDLAIQKQFLAAYNLDDFLYVDRRLASHGAKNNYSVLSLTPILRAYAEEHNTFLHGFPNSIPGTGHWNQKGHGLAGKAIAEWLCEKL
ncbi:MAG: SGNH/GDSL hydrolase family protein [bacterium]|nr:SGNH/GDSL hydrolase family protein [bacterium]MDA1292885.1 SGNH/GDSL hydrolase family protein [bacterium]